MQSISFASGGDPVSVHHHYDLFYVLHLQVFVGFSLILPCPIFSKDTTDYVAYVAKDPVNRRGIFPPCSVVSLTL